MMTFNNKTVLKHSLDIHAITFVAAIISKIGNKRCNSNDAIVTVSNRYDIATALY